MNNRGGDSAREARPGVEDGELIARALQGDQSAFEALVHRYAPLVLRVVRGVLVRSSDAEDIAQEVFLRTYRSLRVLQPGRSLAPWLVRTAVNLCTDHLRRRRRRPERFFSELGPEDTTVLERLLQDESTLREIDTLLLRDLAQKLLARLGPQDRAVLLLKEREGMETREVARVLGCSEVAVRLRLFRARRTLRKLFAGGSHPGGRKT